MQISIYQIDTFTNQIFKGNPAAVCPLNCWIDDQLMQKIAVENNLSETAFFVKTQNGYQIRWFTPTTEVDLCGHATLAAAHVLYHHLNYDAEQINFESKSGILTVMINDDFYTLGFPSDKLKKIDLSQELIKPFEIGPLEAHRGKTDYILVFENEATIKDLRPNLLELSKIDARGIIVTAKGNQCDFVSRFFGPRVGVDEDPVTGSAHTSLIPYWSKILNKTELTAQQVSKRGGQLKCKYNGERVEISGQAVTFLKGTINLESAKY
ncbi:MAG: PhzF family phenazine biosynthesis protein [Bacteroidota bacterium]